MKFLANPIPSHVIRGREVLFKLLQLCAKCISFVISLERMQNRLKAQIRDWQLPSVRPR